MKIQDFNREMKRLIKDYNIPALDIQYAIFIIEELCSEVRHKVGVSEDYVAAFILSMHDEGVVLAPKDHFDPIIGEIDAEKFANYAANVSHEIEKLRNEETIGDGRVTTSKAGFEAALEIIKKGATLGQLADEVGVGCGNEMLPRKRQHYKLSDNTDKAIKILYRPQRSGLAESMAEAKVFDTVDEMLDYIVKQWEEFCGRAPFGIKDLTIRRYGYDSRIGWDANLISTKKMFNEKCTPPTPIGFCTFFKDTPQKDKEMFRDIKSVLHDAYPLEKTYF